MIARLKKDRRDEAYRVYVSDCLKALVGSDQRYAEWVGLVKTDTRSADEIKQTILSGLSRMGEDE